MRRRHIRAFPESIRHGFEELQQAQSSEVELDSFKQVLDTMLAVVQWKCGESRDDGRETILELAQSESILARWAAAVSLRELLLWGDPGDADVIDILLNDEHEGVQRTALASFSTTLDAYFDSHEQRQLLAELSTPLDYDPLRGHPVRREAPDAPLDEWFPLQL